MSFAYLKKSKADAVKLLLLSEEKVECKAEREKKTQVGKHALKNVYSYCCKHSYVNSKHGNFPIQRYLHKGENI